MLIHKRKQPYEILLIQNESKRRCSSFEHHFQRFPWQTSCLGVKVLARTVLPQKILPGQRIRQILHQRSVQGFAGVQKSCQFSHYWKNIVLLGGNSLESWWDKLGRWIVWFWICQWPFDLYFCFEYRYFCSVLQKEQKVGWNTQKITVKKRVGNQA